jgi:hypothetical protein
MSKDDKDEGKRIVAEMKALFGPPALLKSENEADYDTLAIALAQTIKPKDAFGLMQLNDLVLSEWKKNWLRRQQRVILDLGVRQHHQAQARRQRLETEQNERAAGDAADLAALPAGDRRVFELEMKMDDSVADVDALLQNGADETDYARSLRANLAQYAAVDAFVSTETDRRNESAQWIIWYRDVGPALSAKQIDGEVGPLDCGTAAETAERAAAVTADPSTPDASPAPPEPENQ